MRARTPPAAPRRSPAGIRVSHPAITAFTAIWRIVACPCAAARRRSPRPAPRHGMPAEHRLHARFGRRHDRQPVGPAALVEVIVDGVERFVRLDDRGGRSVVIDWLTAASPRAAADTACLRTRSRALPAGVVSTRTHSRAMSDAAVADDRFVAIAQRMRHDDDRQAHVPDAFAHDLRERREGGADDGDGGDAEVFERGRVTRGPGCRRASVADAVDDGVALAAISCAYGEGMPR